MKPKFLVSIFFILLALTLFNVKAFYAYEVIYYFQDGDEYIINDEIDVFYNPFYEDEYPVFPGYDLVKVEVEENVYKLYYDVQYHQVIIKGNGGLTANNETEVVVAEVKHGNNFTFNSMNYRDLFSYPGYELIKFQRSFDSKVTVNQDIIINCVWQPQINYEFNIDNKTYYLRQVLGERIILPNLVYHDHFLGWFDENDVLVDEDTLVSSEENKTIYGKYLSDLITVSTDTISIKKHPSISSPHLFYSDEEMALSEDEEQYLYSNLLANTSYTLLINDVEQLDLTTKSETLIFKLDNMILYDSNYQYYLNGEIILPFNGLIIDDENLVIENNGVILDKSNAINLIQSTYLNSSISSHALKIKSDGIEQYYFFEHCHQIIEQDNDIIFNQLLPNKIYYLVYRLVDDDNYYVTVFNTFAFDLEIFGNQIVIHNANGYQIAFNNQAYYPNQNHDIVIGYLTPNQEYEMKIYHNELTYQVKFMTNQLLSDFSSYNQYEVGDDYIILSNLPSGYKYYLGSEIYNPLDNQLQIYHLKPNTVYTLSCVPLNSDSSFKMNFLTFTTAKVPQDKVELPEKNVEIEEISENQITIKNNPLFEYSIDGINWFSQEQGLLTINNLSPFREYYLYTRRKATTDSEASLAVLVAIFQTLAEVPSQNSFIDLYYTDSFLSFKMKDGYNYYFNHQLITDRDYFEVGNLSPVSKCFLKVERKSDLSSFEMEITLRVLKKLTAQDKEIISQKTFSSFTIKQTKTNLEYKLYDNDELVMSIHGNGEDITFTDLNANHLYQLFILKDFDENYFYEDEYVQNVYIPGNVYFEIDEYLTSIGKKRSQRINKIIEKYAEKINQINSEEEYIQLFEQLKGEIHRIGNQMRIYIVILSILLIFSAVFLTNYVIKKRKK